MRQRERTLRDRQTVLLLRSASARDRWALQAQSFEPALGALDGGLEGWRWLKAHPVWPVGTLVAWLVWRPRRVLGWAGRAVWAWQLWRRARPLLTPWLRQGQRVWQGR